nr:GDSL esterase/lipase EXL3 [Ipomoea batatas]
MNNYIPTVVKCDFPPYGQDFAGGGMPTGRFSNGKTPPDLIAEELGIKEVVPAYLDPNLQPEDLKTGVSFASGACGYDPETAEITELYEIGARRIGVFGLPPIGCVPSQRTLGGGPGRSCSEKSNEAAKLVNSKLSAQIDSLSKTLPNSKLVLIDIYEPALRLIQNPKQYGFEVVDRGCCGTGKIEVSILCNKFSETCPDHDKYLFWDSYHPTEKGYRILVNQILQKYINRLL